MPPRNPGRFTIHFKLDPTKPHADRVSYNVIEVTFEDEIGLVSLDVPFEVITGPGEAVDLLLKKAEPSYFSSGPGDWSNTILVEAVDIFGNPVSNVSVTASASGSTPGIHAGSVGAKVFDATTGGMWPGNPNVWNCGTGSYSEVTAPFGGAGFGLINGSESNIRYHWTIEGAGVVRTLSNTVSDRSESEVKASFVVKIDGNENLTNSVKVGETYPDPLHFNLTQYKVTNEIKSTPLQRAQGEGGISLKMR